MEDMGMTDKFPSPFGVRVLKCLLHKYEQQNLVKVSVPFRGSCSEICRGAAGKSSTTAFPSPFGVRVLKCHSQCHCGCR